MTEHIFRSDSPNSHAELRNSVVTAVASICSPAWASCTYDDNNTIP